MHQAKVAQPAAQEVVLNGPRCHQFVSRLLKFLVFFYGLKCICHQNTPKLYLLFLLWAYHPQTCITSDAKICQFFRFGLLPYKLAILRATTGLITSWYRIKHKTYQNKGICYVTIAYCYVTKTFVARNKFPHVKVARNTKKVGRVCIRQTSDKVCTESNATNRYQALASSQENILNQARNQLGTPG